MATVQTMLAGFLEAAGFAAMARDVKTETDPKRLQHYARVVLRSCVSADKRPAVHSRFVLLRLV